MSSDCKIAVRRESIHDAGEHLLLKGRREIGERDIAAKDEIEEQSGAFLSHVLMQELNALSILRLDAVQGPDTIKGLLDEVWRQFAQAGWLKATPAGARERSFVEVSRHD